MYLLHYSYREPVPRPVESGRTKRSRRRRRRRNDLKGRRKKKEEAKHGQEENYWAEKKVLKKDVGEHDGRHGKEAG